MLAVAVTDGDHSASGGWRIAIATRDFAPHVCMLSADERARCDATRARDAADTRRAAHVLKRELVGQRLNVAPEQLVFASTEGGPRLSPPHDAVLLSLSHTIGAVAVAVADTPVGVDIEVIARADDPVRLAARVFAPEEARLIRASADPHFEFAWRWTAKEALLKACGMPLSEALATPLDLDPRRRGDGLFVLEARGARVTVFSPAPAYVCAVAKITSRGHRTARTSH